MDKEDGKTSLFPNIETKVIDFDRDEEVHGGTAGELCVRGPIVAKGYWQNMEATEKSFAKDGWLRTGDAATVDGSGSFSVLARVQVRPPFSHYTITALKSRPLGSHQGRQSNNSSLTNGTCAFEPSSCPRCCRLWCIPNPGCISSRNTGEHGNFPHPKDSSLHRQRQGLKSECSRRRRLHGAGGTDNAKPFRRRGLLGQYSANCCEPRSPKNFGT